MTTIELRGLDGSNPLAFLAALGVLEACTDLGHRARLQWTDAGVWHPVLSGCSTDIEVLIADLVRDQERSRDSAALDLTYEGKRDLKPPPPGYRGFLEGLMESVHPDRRLAVDWAGAFATDIALDRSGNTKPTALHFTAGQQQFLAMVRDLASQATPEDLREALQGPWTYSRPLPVMGWDATASRDYALRARNPSGDKKQGVPGADWLAVRGLVGIQTVPSGGRILTTGCAGGWKTGSFSWPLWVVPLERDLVRSLLRQTPAEMTSAEREARGVAQVFRSGIRRSDQGGYGSFDPPVVL